MSLHIQNERTVALVRELARRTGLSQASAVEVAVRAKLADIDAGGRRQARRARVDALLSDLDRSITMRQKRQIRRSQVKLYDKHGLPR